MYLNERRTFSYRKLLLTRVPRFFPLAKLSQIATDSFILALKYVFFLGFLVIKYRFWVKGGWWGVCCQISLLGSSM